MTGAILRPMRRPPAIVVLHAALAALAAIELFRAAQQSWLADVIADADARTVFELALPAASAAASALSIALGLRSGLTRRAALTDACGIAVAFGALGLLGAGPETREVVGLFFVLALVARLLPSALLVVRGVARSAIAVFVLALLFYAPLALWSGAATAAQGDQPHYLLAADALAHGTADLAPEYADPLRFQRLALTPLSTADLDTHVVASDRGGRLVQGYALSALIAPGWAIGGRAGALLVMAVIAALLSAQLFGFCIEIEGDHAGSRIAWALAAFLAPISTLATVIYPNVVGALALLCCYRWLFTAPVRRPVLAGLAGGVLLLLTPRDAIGLVALVPFAFSSGRAVAWRFIGVLAVSAVAIAALDAVLYGVAVPYAGYLAGLDAAQRLDGVPSLRPRADIGLGGTLFDRAFGLAGSAPWVFIGLAGIGPALRRRAAFLPALAAIGLSLAALSIYRLWEGGWAPANRYFVEVLPLWTPFIALALRRPGPILAALTAVLAGLGAAATLLFVAIPNFEFNTVDSAQVIAALDRILILDPLGLLPSFEDASAIGPALLRSVPLLAAAVALVIVGVRRAREAV